MLYWKFVIILVGLISSTIALYFPNNPDIPIPNLPKLPNGTIPIPKFPRCKKLGATCSLNSECCSKRCRVLIYLKKKTCAPSIIVPLRK